MRDQDDKEFPLPAFSRRPVSFSVVAELTELIYRPFSSTVTHLTSCPHFFHRILVAYALRPIHNKVYSNKPIVLLWL